LIPVGLYIFETCYGLEREPHGAPMIDLPFDFSFPYNFYWGIKKCRPTSWPKVSFWCSIFESKK